jgi:hypothetical protein
MTSRSASARLALVAAAVGSLATTSYPHLFVADVVVDGPALELVRGEPVLVLVDVDYGAERPLELSPKIAVRVASSAGRPPGNPEVAVRILDRSSGAVLAEHASRDEAFEVFAMLDCEVTTACLRDFELEFEVTAGSRADVEWVLGMTADAPDRPDLSDTDPQPPIVTLTLE